VSLRESVLHYDRSDEIRTNEQGKKFHALVADIARHVEWAGAKMDPETWKRVLLAAKYGQRIVPNPLTEAGEPIVVNVRRTRGLTVPEMSEFIAEVEAFAAVNGVPFSDDE
jgi:hypothetical protein